MVDIYDSKTPVSLAHFVNYFRWKKRFSATWLNDTNIADLVAKIIDLLC